MKTTEFTESVCDRWGGVGHADVGSDVSRCDPVAGSDW
jgi:hypothetical protein